VPVPLNTLLRTTDDRFVIENARAACILWSPAFADPDEVRIYHDGQHIGDIFKDEDIRWQCLRKKVSSRSIFPGRRQRGLDG